MNSPSLARAQCDARDWRSRVNARTRVFRRRARRTRANERTKGERDRGKMMGRSRARGALALAFAIAACVVASTAHAAVPVTNVTVEPTTTNLVACSPTQTTFGPDYDCPVGTGTCYRNQVACNHFTWEYENTIYFVNGETSTLPDPFTGLPRVNPQTQEKYEGQMVLNEDYGLSLASQAMPGLVIAVLLLLSMILVLIFYLLSACCKCCGLCNCCFRPQPYTRKALHIAKGIQLAFVIMAAAGCLMIYIRSPDLTKGVLKISDGLVNSTSALVDDVTYIAETIGNLTNQDADVTSGLTDLSDAATTVKEQITDTRDLIEKYVDQIQLGADILSGVLLGVAFITMVLSVLNFWRILIFFSIITSLILILCWIVVGVLSAIGVLLEDFCYTGTQYVINPKLVDLSKDIPCPAESDVVKFGNEFRQMVSNIVSDVNTQVHTFNGFNSGRMKDYICVPYQAQTIASLCGSTPQVTAGTTTSPFWNDTYTNYVCEAHANGVLSGVTTAYPVWDKLLGNCVTGGGYTNYTMTATNSVRQKNKYLISDPSLSTDAVYGNLTGVNATKMRKDLADLNKVNDIIPTFEGILRCDFITNMFLSINEGCYDTANAIQDMWKGFVVISVAYLMLWITMLVTIGRMSNEDMMIDGGKFDAKKAGLV